MFLEKIHVFFEILFVFLEILKGFLFILSWVEYSVLHLFLLFVSIKIIWGLKDILEFSFDVELPVYIGEKFGFVLVSKWGFEFLQRLRHLFDKML